MNKKGAELIFPLFFVGALVLTGLTLFQIVAFGEDFGKIQKDFDMLASKYEFQEDYLNSLFTSSAENAYEKAKEKGNVEEEFCSEFKDIIRERNLRIGYNDFFDKALGDSCEILKTEEGYSFGIYEVVLNTKQGNHDLWQKVDFEISFEE